MKKIYVMAAFLGASSFAFNQVAQKAPVNYDLERTSKSITTNNNGEEKALGTVLWSSDFSTPAADWSIQAPGNQGTWEFGAIADLPTQSFVIPVQSPSASNGIAFFNGLDYLIAGSIETQDSYIEMVNSIDCTGETVITLSFWQAYNAFNSDQTLVELSTDGGATWSQSVDINPSVNANDDATEFEVFRNFTVNGSNDVKFRFRWLNENDSDQFGSGYVWQIDDVAVTTLSDHDIATRSLNYGSVGLFYHQIPEAQIAPIESSIVLLNQGSSDQTNVKFNASESIAGNYTSSSAPASIVTGTEDSVTVATAFTPSGQGNYKLDYSVSFDNTDDVPSNNILPSYKFKVVENLYARDSSNQAETGMVYGQMTGSNQTPPVEIQPAGLFDIFADAELTGIDFQFGTTITDGAQVFGEILDGNRDPVANGETMPYITQTGDEGSYQTLVFDTPLSLTAGETYFVVVKCYTADFSVATAGKSAPQTSFVFYPGEPEWYYTTSTPVIRMNFDPSLGLENNELSNLNVSSNFPNPFANETTVQFNLKEASDVSYSVVDMTGKVMTEVSEGNTMAGDHKITIDGSSFANGVYYLNITAGETSVTRKMIVNK